MSNFELKVLWALDINTPISEERLLAHAKAAGANAICVRTPGKRLPELVGRTQQLGLKVYAWRWPAVKPQPGSKTHYYAKDEAAFVAGVLIPAGLDGYILDPESDRKGAADDWNSQKHTGLAKDFCKTIRDAAVRARRKGFRFGLSSGCGYPSDTGKPNIPWSEFAAASDVFIPQTYWRVAKKKNGQYVGAAANGGTPSKAVSKGLTIWRSIAEKKSIVPMAGELALITPEEIASYGSALASAGVTEAHVYVDGPKIAARNLAALRDL